jgi:hypothetical protein
MDPYISYVMGGAYDYEISQKSDSSPDSKPKPVKVEENLTLTEPACGHRLWMDCDCA